MREKTKDAAQTAVLNIFETMFFMFLDPIEEEMAEVALSLQENIEFLESEIRFKGKESGFLRIQMSYPLAENLTMNFMGFEDEATEEQILDMASELSNMVCGNIFSLLDKTSVYILDSPKTRKVTPGEMAVDKDPSNITLDFLSDGQKVTLVIHFDNNS